MICPKIALLGIGGSGIISWSTSSLNYGIDLYGIGIISSALFVSGYLWYKSYIIACNNLEYYYPEIYNTEKELSLIDTVKKYYGYASSIIVSGIIPSIFIGTLYYLSPVKVNSLITL
jgi:hypothetical protein